jgi:hypothetical protein
VCIWAISALAKGTRKNYVSWRIGDPMTRILFWLAVTLAVGAVPLTALAAYQP